MKQRDFKRIRREAHGSLTELNITPLLDLVFVLLVIFIITTPQLTNSLEINLPSSQPPPATPEPKPRINRILVNAKGQAFLNDEFFSTAALKVKLQNLKSTDSDLRVVLSAEDDADYQSIVSVLDVLQQLEITKVGLATEAAQ